MAEREKEQKVFNEWDRAIAAMYADIETVYDLMDPVRFEGLVRNVLLNQDVDKSVILRNTPFKEGLNTETRDFVENQIEDYLGLKKMELQLLQAGYFTRWRKKIVLEAIVKMDEVMGEKYIYTRFVQSAIATELWLEMKKNRHQNTEAEKENDKGDELREEERYEEALSHLDKAIALSPRYCLPRVNKGICLKNLGRINDAIICYVQALDIDPYYKKAKHNMAVAFATAGDFKSASRFIEEALEIDPDYEASKRLKAELDRLENT